MGGALAVLYGATADGQMHGESDNQHGEWEWVGDRSG